MIEVEEATTVAKQQEDERRKGQNSYDRLATFFVLFIDQYVVIMLKVAIS